MDSNLERKNDKLPSAVSKIYCIDRLTPDVILGAEDTQSVIDSEIVTELGIYQYDSPNCDTIHRILASGNGCKINENINEKCPLETETSTFNNILETITDYGMNGDRRVIMATLGIGCLGLLGVVSFRKPVCRAVTQLYKMIFGPLGRMLGSQVGAEDKEIKPALTNKDKRRSSNMDNKENAVSHSPKAQGKNSPAGKNKEQSVVNRSPRVQEGIETASDSFNRLDSEEGLLCPSAGGTSADFSSQESKTTQDVLESTNPATSLGSSAEAELIQTTSAAPQPELSGVSQTGEEAESSESIAPIASSAENTNIQASTSPQSGPAVAGLSQTMAAATQPESLGASISAKEAASSALYAEGLKMFANTK